MGQAAAGDLEVGVGDELPFPMYREAPRQLRRQHHEGRDELARERAIDADGTTGEGAAFDLEGRVALRSKIGDVRAEASEGLHKRPKGAFAHARIAIQHKGAFSRSQQRRQGPHGRARIPQMKM